VLSQQNPALRKSGREAVTSSCRKKASGKITVQVPDGKIRIGNLQSIIHQAGVARSEFEEVITQSILDFGF
jgi:hypothetical protein